jgi:hypothetical protein
MLHESDHSLHGQRSSPPGHPREESRSAEQRAVHPAYIPPLPAARPGFPRTLTTLAWDKRPAWTSRVEVLRHGELSPLAILRRLGAAADYDAVVVDGATGGAVRLSDLGGAVLLARRRSGPTVIVTDATWGRGGGLADRVACRAALRAIDGPRTVYCVLSQEETRTFPRTWGVDPTRVAFTAFYFTIGDEDLALPTSRNGGVFAGGDSLRDYGPLLAAARSLGAPVTIATRTLAGRGDLPANVRAGPVSHARFMDLMRKAAAVAVPLARTSDRSAGQQTFLNAMALGKVVIVPDVLGVRDYVRHGRTGLVVPPGDADALAAALRWALDPANGAAVEEMGECAREEAFARFTPEHYVERVMDVVERYARRRQTH